MNQKRDRFGHENVLFLVNSINILLMTAVFTFVWYAFYAEILYKPFYSKGDILVIVIFFVLYVMYAKTYNSFSLSYSKISELVLGQFLACLFSDLIMYLISWLLIRQFPNVFPLLLGLGLQLLVAIVWSYFFHQWYFNRYPGKKTIIIYMKTTSLYKLIDDYGLNKKFSVTNMYTFDELQAKGCDILKGAETVFIIDVPSSDRNPILKYCLMNQIEVYSKPKIGDAIMSGAERRYLFHLPLLRMARSNPSVEYVVLKRLFDIVSSGIVLIIISPILLVTALIIKLTDRGPVFYKQVRLTKDGKEFKILKFRSMRVDAEKDGVARLSTGEKDDRITPVGKFIRKVRIDELPQLLNILKGDMSVVGPRPERPEIAKQYEETLPEFSLRLQVKAGLTGLAQVYGKYNTTPKDKLLFDLMYIAHPSFVEDLRIVFATIKIIFIPESTEGIADGQTTAQEKAEKL